MAPIKFHRIISVSSEDPNHTASNLLKTEVGSGCWKCKDPGEKKAVVIIELQESTTIDSVDVGNENTAFIEVLVGKSASPDSFQVLITASTLMTVQEAKSGMNKNGVRFFKYDQLVKPVADELWDRIKIICSQPFNNRVQYGLSFIKLSSKQKNNTVDDTSEKQHCTLGKFMLKADNEENISIGSLFAKRKDVPQPSTTAAAAIRDASQNSPISPLLGKLTLNKNEKKYNTSSTPSSKCSSAKKKTDGDGDNSKDKTRKATRGRLLYTEEDEEAVENDKNKKQNDISKTTNIVIQKQNDGSKTFHADSSGTAIKRTNDATTGGVQKKPKLDEPERKKKPFNKLFQNVTFAISGYQNPYRGELRSKALQMGAKYKPDWDQTCNYLICAFSNTPKYNQVKGHGRIVQKDWIEDCYARRKRLPWKKYVLSESDARDSESDEEIWEDTPINNVPGKANVGSSSSGSDTDDEIERVRLRLRKENEKQQEIEKKNSETDDKKEIKIEPASQSIGVYDAETDTDSDSTYIDSDDIKNTRADPNNVKDEEPIYNFTYTLPDTGKGPLPPLPEFFYCIKFYIDSNFDQHQKELLKRHIVPYKGEIIDTIDRADFIITDSSFKNKSDSSVSLEDKIRIRQDWIWDCHDKSSLLDVEPYVL